MRRVLLHVLCFMLCAAVAVSAGRAAWAARARWADARGSHDRLKGAADGLRAMQASAEAVGGHQDGMDPQSAMVARVSNALTKAGVPVARMTSLSPAGSTPVGAAMRLSDDTTVSRVRRSASVTLDSVSLPDVGAFLDAWREEQPAWRVSSIQLTPIPLRPGDLTNTTPLPGNTLARPLTVHLTLESTMMERTRSQ